MKKIIHALFIVDKSGSMERFVGRTIEGINQSINALKKEADKDTVILHTLMQFSSGNSWISRGPNTDFVFTHVGKNVNDISELTDNDYRPNGGTPLLDAIGNGIEKVKEFHGDYLEDDNVNLMVTVFTDGEENSSRNYTHDQIGKMINHFQTDGKWTFTFVGCGSFDGVSKVSAGLGISAANTVAYVCSDEGVTQAYSTISSGYTTYMRAMKSK